VGWDGLMEMGWEMNGWGETEINREKERERREEVVRYKKEMRRKRNSETEEKFAIQEIILT